MSYHDPRSCRRCLAGGWCADEERDKAWWRWHESEACDGINPLPRRSHGYGVARFEGFDQWGGRVYDDLSADPLEEDRRG